MSLTDYFKTISEKARAKVAVALSEAQEDAPEASKETKEEVESTPEKFVEATLSNGTVVNIEPNLEVGATVTAEIEGEIVAAPDGQHELQDGTIITTEGGVIVDIQPMEMEEEKVEEQEMEEAVEPEARQPKKVITREEIESIFAAQFEAFKESLDNSELTEKVEKLQEAFEVIVDGLGEIPSDKPAVEPKKTFGKMDRQKSMLDRLKKYRK